LEGNKVKKIDILINQAKILSYSVELNEDRPEVTAVIGLFAAGKKISTFSLSTENWHDKKFELPSGVIEPILKIAEELESILVRECSATIGLLKSGEFN
jgi:hypothetical protein